MKIEFSYVESLNFNIKPEDQGQIVEVSYASDGDGVWQQIWDRSDNTKEFYFGAYPKRATEEQLRHEPYNSKIAKHNKFKKVKIIKAGVKT